MASLAFGALTSPSKLDNLSANNKTADHELFPKSQKLSLTTTELSRGSIELGTHRIGSASPSTRSPPNKLGKRWMQYQGSDNWEGLLDPLDHNLRSEILRYGQFVEAAYRSFDFDPLSPTYAACRFSRNSLLQRSGFGSTGYRVSKNLRASSGVEMPRWTQRMPSWMTAKSSWVGYVAVCQDKDEIARLGRRDVVIAYRGTATCLEWLENLRATLTDFPGSMGPAPDCGPMVERGFYSLYTSRTSTCPSLQDMIREEIARVVESYGDEPLSLTITGHSLGAALAILSAYDITTSFASPPMVTVISFGGPRVGNRSLSRQLDKSGTRVLRIVNSDDPITKVPGFVIDDDDVERPRDDDAVGGLPRWIQKLVEETQWVYADVGQELKLSSKESAYVSKGGGIATCHDLKTYLDLVKGFVGSTCPSRATTVEGMLSPNFNRF